MIKIVVIGVWITIAALGSFYGMMLWQSDKKIELKPDGFFGVLEQVNIDTVSVPIIYKSQVSGYVLAKFVFLADGNDLKKMSVPAQLILTDEAFRAIYVGSFRDFQRLERYDLAALTNLIKKNANKRFGAPIIKDVLVDSINYVPKSEVRKRTARKN